MKMILPREECYTGIQKFYDNVALKAGCTDIANVNYDCTDISVSPAIEYEIHKYYEDEGVDTVSFGMKWLVYGPKVNINLDGFKVEIGSKFIIKED